MDNGRTSILQRILNLRTTEGRTEAEALSYMQRAERLMHAYHIEEAELAMAEATGRIKIEIIETTIYQQGRNRHRAHDCCYRIEQLTGTECVYKAMRHPSFLGDKPDVEYAVFLYELIQDAMEREYANYKRATPLVGRGAKAAFQRAMGARINARLLEMVEARKTEAEERKKAEALRLSVDPSVIESMVVPEAQAELTTTALVILAYEEQKSRDVQAEFKRRYPKLRTLRQSYTVQGNGTAYSAGCEAGGRVHLGRSLTTNSGARLAS